MVSFVALCVLNKCQKVIPHSVITWSFFHFGAHSLEQEEISHHIPEWNEKKSEIEREMQRFLAAQLYFCFSSCFFHLSRWVYLEMYFISFEWVNEWVPNINSNIWVMGTVKLNKRTDEKSLSWIRDTLQTRKPPSDSRLKVNFNRLDFSFILLSLSNSCFFLRFCVLKTFVRVYRSAFLDVHPLMCVLR